MTGPDKRFCNISNLASGISSLTAFMNWQTCGNNTSNEALNKALNWNSLVVAFEIISELNYSQETQRIVREIHLNSFFCSLVVITNINLDALAVSKNICLGQCLKGCLLILAVLEDFIKKSKLAFVG